MYSSIYDDIFGASVLARHRQRYGGNGEPFSRLCFGGMVGGISCATVATPFERLRVLLQTQSKTGGVSPLATLKEVYGKGGAKALMTGWPITVMREIPGCIVWLGSYVWVFVFSASSNPHIAKKGGACDHSADKIPSEVLRLCCSHVPEVEWFSFGFAYSGTFYSIGWTFREVVWYRLSMSL
jgi:hypothetical protein